MPETLHTIIMTFTFWCKNRNHWLCWHHQAIVTMVCSLHGENIIFLPNVVFCDGFLFLCVNTTPLTVLPWPVTIWVSLYLSSPHMNQGQYFSFHNLLTLLTSSITKIKARSRGLVVKDITASHIYMILHFLTSESFIQLMTLQPVCSCRVV